MIPRTHAPPTPVARHSPPSGTATLAAITGCPPVVRVQSDGRRRAKPPPIRFHGDERRRKDFGMIRGPSPQGCRQIHGIHAHGLVHGFGHPAWPHFHPAAFAAPKPGARRIPRNASRVWMSALRPLAVPSPRRRGSRGRQCAAPSFNSQAVGLRATATTTHPKPPADVSYISALCQARDRATCETAIRTNPSAYRPDRPIPGAAESPWEPVSAVCGVHPQARSHGAPPEA